MFNIDKLKYSFIEKVMLSPSYLYGVPKYYEVLNATNKVPSDDINIYGLRIY